MGASKSLLAGILLILWTWAPLAQEIGHQKVPWRLLGNPRFSKARKLKLEKLLNDTWNYGGCGGPIAYCLNTEPKDTWTIRTAKAVMRMMKMGMSDGQITIEMLRRDNSVNTRNILSFDLANRPFRGKKNAPVKIVVWSDFQCPACKKTAGILDKVFEKYKDKVGIYFKNFPIVKHHPRALKAALAAIAAAGFGKFWQMHDLLFKNAPDRLSDRDLLEMAASLKINKKAFKKAMESPKSYALLEKDIKEANKIKLDRTPVLFFNGKRFIARKDFDTLCERVEEELDLIAEAKKNKK
ncbi:MAG: thioredoxin domain-containing protein [Deltaproteobacteria bacterium]|nr:thioredoxin domain-containing protein [Deltaproteobacteria bacterium]